MNKKRIFSVHIILVILAWTSPFYLSWKIIALLIILNYVQILIFKGCILTNLQFKNKINKYTDMTMYSYSLELLGYKFNRKKIKFLSKYIFPVIIMGIALIWQILLKISVLIKV